jgi:hypothetical protein
MTQNLTVSSPELERLIRQTPSGMMHWSGTGPAKATCAGCQHYGYRVEVCSFAGTALAPLEYRDRCKLYYQYTQRHGGKVPSATPACKYFTPKESVAADGAARRITQAADQTKGN